MSRECFKHLVCFVVLSMVPATLVQAEKNLTQEEAQKFVHELLAAEVQDLEKEAHKKEQQDKVGKADAAKSAPDTPENTTLYTNVDNLQLQMLLDADILVVDIRRKVEWEETGVIAGSTLLTMFNKSGEVEPKFEQAFPLLCKPDEPVALISETGVRSKVAAEILSEQLGYTKLYHVTEGLVGWLEAELDVVDPHYGE